MSPCAPRSGPATVTFAATSREPKLLEATLAPLPRDTVLAACARQSGLDEPAKLVLTARGEPGLLAEIPSAAHDDASAACARDILARARRWLEDEAYQDAAGAGDAAADEFLESAFTALGWSWRAAGEGTYEISSRPGGRVNRMTAQLRPGRGFRLVLPPLAIRCRTTSAVAATQWFALEANRRLRLARITLGEGSPGLIRVSWDVVLTPSREHENWLQHAATALLFARDQTARALRALGNPAVAEMYLKAREPPAAAQIIVNRADG